MLKDVAASQAGYPELANLHAEAGREVRRKARRAHAETGGQGQFEKLPAVEDFDLGHHRARVYSTGVPLSNSGPEVFSKSAR